jgi:hypothetical protein
MTFPHPVAAAVTPRDRLAEVISRAFTDAGAIYATESPAEAILAAADVYAAELIEQCARSPRNQHDPRYPNGAGP